MRVILASASPRRRELLAQIGIDFEIVVSNVEEKVSVTEPSRVVEELSAQKALATWEMVAPEADGDSGETEGVLVIGADTIVACDGQILGKPKDGQDAKEMLTLLQGRAHEVYTGVTLVRFDAGTKEVKRKSFHEVTKVFFYPMSEEEIEEYVATGDPLDKAGSYGIQGLCARYISGISGDYNNVVGLPVGRLYQEMKEEERG